MKPIISAMKKIQNDIVLTVWKKYKHYERSGKAMLPHLWRGRAYQSVYDEMTNIIKREKGNYYAVTTIYIWSYSTIYQHFVSDKICKYIHYLTIMWEQILRNVQVQCTSKMNTTALILLNIQVK